MRILAKFNLVLILVFGAAVSIAGYIARQFLQQHARDEVIQEAQPMVGAAGADLAHAPAPDQLHHVIVADGAANFDAHECSRHSMRSLFRNRLPLRFAIALTLGAAR